jgi:hypothetical protein
MDHRTGTGSYPQVLSSSEPYADTDACLELAGMCNGATPIAHTAPVENPLTYTPATGRLKDEEPCR